MKDRTAVLDACVIYPASLRDLLVELAWRGLYQARWTDEIHEEWIRNLKERRPDLDSMKLERTRRQMDRSVRGGLVTGYEALIPALVLPDRDDRYVLAAAIHSGAGVIVTVNLRDFPADVLGPFEIEARHPDDFLSELIDDHPEQVCSVVEDIRRRLANPPRTMEDYLNNLESQGLPQAVARLRELLDLA